MPQLPLKENPVNASLFPILEVVKLNSGLLEKGLCDLDRPALVRRPLENVNPILWIAGHLTWARYGMASFLGAKLAFPLPPMFAKGAAVEADAALPEAEALLAAWREVSAALTQAMTDATDMQLVAPAPRAFPIADKSVLGGLTFLTYHEGYHLGQIALLRKALGASRLIDA
jgi:uncharacterized damage-inducible protein DinB